MYAFPLTVPLGRNAFSSSTGDVDRRCCCTNTAVSSSGCSTLRKLSVTALRPLPSSVCRHVLFAPQAYHVNTEATFSLTTYARRPFNVTAKVSYETCTCSPRSVLCVASYVRRLTVYVSCVMRARAPTCINAAILRTFACTSL